MAKLRDMSEEKKSKVKSSDPVPESSPKEVEFEDEDLKTVSLDSHQQDGEGESLSGDTIVELAAIPFFVGGENFVKTSDDQGDKTVENKAKGAGRSGADEAPAEDGDAENAGETASVPEEEEDDDTVASFADFESMFPEDE